MKLTLFFAEKWMLLNAKPKAQSLVTTSAGKNVIILSSK